MAYFKKDYSKLKGTPGFSNEALDIHFALYEGYVVNANAILENLDRMRKGGKTASSECAELKRRLGWEFNGMLMHEYYFSGLGGDGEVNKESGLYRAIEKNFGSFEEWRNDFETTAKMRGIGWAALYKNPENDSLINFWINEHNENHPAGFDLILNLDVFEHAYMVDYGKDRAAYVSAFMKNIDWKEIEKRFK